MAEKPTKTARKRATPRKVAADNGRKIEHDEIAARAYFIYLDDGHGELDNWLRAERELSAA